MTENYLNYLKAVFILMIFFLESFIFSLVCSLIGFKLDANNIYHLALLNFIAPLVVTVLVVLVYHKIIKNGKIRIKEKYGKNVRDFIKQVFIAFVIMYVIKIMAGMVEMFFLGLFGIENATVDNQNMISELLESAPAMMIISTCILAPVEEELIFRGAIGQMFKNKKVFITVSGLIFGLMHVTDNYAFLIEVLIIGTMLDLIYSIGSFEKREKHLLSVAVLVLILFVFGIFYYFQYGNLLVKIMSLDLVEVFGSIVYISLGVYLAYIYVEYDNILLNIGVHAINNTLGMLLTLFLM